jgi:hypothetical protein
VSTRREDDLADEPAPTYRVYGFTLQSDVAFETSLYRASGPADVTFTWSGQDPIWRAEGEVRCLHESPVPGPGQSSELGLFRGRDYELIRLADVAEYTLGPTQIHCKLLDSSKPHAVEINLLGVVLAYWMEQRKHLALHASAVQVGDQCVLFFGTNGVGKSTLAALMVQRGHALLSDDIVAVSQHGEGFVAQPSFPQMRMWPAQAQYFLGRTRPLKLAHPDFTKLRIPVGDGGFGRYAHAPLPVRAIYLVEEDSQLGDAAVTIEPLSPGAATIELIRHSFVPNMVAAAGLSPERLVAITTLLGQARARRLVHSPGTMHYARIVDALEHDLATA